MDQAVKDDLLDALQENEDLDDGDPSITRQSFISQQPIKQPGPPPDRPSTYQDPPS
jgi:hypothetical protein